MRITVGEGACSNAHRISYHTITHAYTVDAILSKRTFRRLDRGQQGYGRHRVPVIRPGSDSNIIGTIQRSDTNHIGTIPIASLTITVLQIANVHHIATSFASSPFPANLPHTNSFP